MKVSIITATIGKPQLANCIESVRNQTYKNIEHIVVVDGRERWEATDEILNAVEFPNGTNEHVSILPYATGTDRFNGHRIYGAYNFLSSGDYIIWLDDDNTIASDHIESLVKLAQENQLHWAYSLRKIIDSKGEFICNDDCESLGKWKSVLNDNFVDVNCFFVRRDVAIQTSPIWNRKAREPGVMEVDRALSAVLMHPNNKLNFDTNGKYSVNYRVGSTGISVKADFFTKGNKIMKKNYKGAFPWKK